MTRLTGALALSASLMTISTAAMAEDRTMCVYDPAGTAGDAYQSAEDFQVEAQSQGVTFKLKPYTDEATAAADLRSGQCDSAMLTGVRASLFKLRSYSVEAMGALPTYDMLGKTVKLLSTEAAAPLMVTGDYETAGISPAGAVYLYVKDRAWTDLADLSGKKIATMDFDLSARTMVDKVGGSMVPADIGTFAGMFNNGAVDVIYAPATAYTPLELYRGVGANGGVVRYPLAQLTLQLVIRHDRFPEGFGLWARGFTAGKFSSNLAKVKRIEAEVKPASWMEIEAAQAEGYGALFRNVRLDLRSKGQYDAKILKLMKRVRCKADATNAECAMDTE